MSNIKKRRDYIKSLLDAGIKINKAEVAKLWGTSQASITSDIASCQGMRSPYYKKKSRVFMQNVRAAKLGVEGVLQEQDWADILLAYDYSCAICRSKGNLSIDHIVPLSKGGNNTKENAQPLCVGCNSRKKDRTPQDKIPEKKVNKIAENGRNFTGRPRVSVDSIRASFVLTISRGDWLRFEEKCNQKGVTQAEMLRGLITGWVEKEKQA